MIFLEEQRCFEKDALALASQLSTWDTFGTPLQYRALCSSTSQDTETSSYECIRHTRLQVFSKFPASCCRRWCEASRGPLIRVRAERSHEVCSGALSLLRPPLHCSQWSGCVSSDPTISAGLIRTPLISVRNPLIIKQIAKLPKGAEIRRYFRIEINSAMLEMFRDVHRTRDGSSN